MSSQTEIFNSVLAMPWAQLGIRVEGAHIVALALSTETLSEAPGHARLAQHAQRRLVEYLAGGVWPEDLPLAPVGTPFQQRVWRLLRAIPAGQTRTYGDIARSLSTSPRAVGGACRANPIVLLIPCHRVVAANGEGGFAGQREGIWPAIKHRLLRLEGAVSG